MKSRPPAAAPGRSGRGADPARILVLNVRGFNVVVFGSRKGYGIKISQRFGDRCQFGRKRYATAAQPSAAFTALLWCEQTWAATDATAPFNTNQERAR